MSDGGVDDQAETNKTKRDKKSAKCPYCYTFSIKTCPEGKALKPLVESVIKGDNIFSGLRNREVKELIDGMKNRKNPAIKEIIDEELERFKVDPRKTVPNIYWATIGEMYDKIVTRLKAFAETEDTEILTNHNPHLNSSGRQITIEDGEDHMFNLDLDVDFNSLEGFYSALRRDYEGREWTSYEVGFECTKIHPPELVSISTTRGLLAFKEHLMKCEEEGKPMEIKIHNKGSTNQ